MSGPVTFHISSTTVPNNSFRCMMLSDGEIWLKSSIFVEWRSRAYSIGESLFTFLPHPKMHAVAKTGTIRQSLTNGENVDNSPNFTLSSQNAHVIKMANMANVPMRWRRGPIQSGNFGDIGKLVTLRSYCMYVYTWGGRKFHRRYFKAKMRPFINFVVILTVMGNTLSTGHWVDLGKIIFCQNMSY